MARKSSPSNTPRLIETRNDAYQYLADRGFVKPGKSDYTTKYLLRKARQIEIQEKAGKKFETPQQRKEATQEARGHKRASFSSLEQSKQGLEQDRMTAKQTKKGHAKMNRVDLERLIILAAPKAADKKSILLIVCGEPGTGSTDDVTFVSGAKRCYSTRTKFSDLTGWLEDNPKETLEDFAEEATGDIPWNSISSISIAYPPAKE